MSETLDNVSGPAKRPAFLTVLIVLTFIGSAWGIYGALTVDPALSDYAGYYPWVTLILCLGTAFGAYQMLSLKKSGLYIWTAAEVISVILMWVVVKGFISDATGMAGEASGSELGMQVASASNEVLQAAMNLALIIGSIFPAVFVLLYWLNAKHMK